MGRIKSAIERDIEKSYILNFDRIDSYKSDHIDYFDKHFPCIEEDYSEEPESDNSIEFNFWLSMTLSSMIYFILLHEGAHWKNSVFLSSILGCCLFLELVNDDKIT